MTDIHEQYLNAGVISRMFERCPHIKPLGDVDFCKLTERPSGRIRVCVRMSGKKCDYYDAWLRETE